MTIRPLQRSKTNFPNSYPFSKVPTDAQGPIYPLPQLFNIVWCIKDTETYLILNPGTPLPSNTVVTILKGAERAVTEWIASRGDGMLQNGRFTWYGRAQSRIVFQVQNANNHQVMYGVLLTALTGMETYMWRLGYGCVDFKLYDGWNQVGQGSLAYG